MLTALVAALAAGCGGSSGPNLAGGCLSAPPAGAAHGVPPPAPIPATQPPAPAGVLIRVNQVSYAEACPKLAFVMSRVPLPDDGFRVLDAGGARVLSGRLGPSRGPFGAWRDVYPLDFSAVRRAGSYVLVTAGRRSEPVRVAEPAELYRPLTAGALEFFQAQRDGPQVIAGALGRRPSHLRDAHATVYRTPTYRGTALLGGLQPTAEVTDTSGGWFDAGDYLKFVQTSSFNDALLLFSLRQYPKGIADLGGLRAEARFGTDWLLRMWDQQRRVLYFQVGIGDGNGSSILGDHDLWRLPQADDAMPAKPGSPTYYLAKRPVFAANTPGGPISPNLAGRLAGAFGLCAQVFADSDRAYAHRCLLAGQGVYDLAQTQPAPARLLTTVPDAYYNETEWRDDMELGGIELYLGTRKLGGPSGVPHRDANFYLAPAGHWADAYITAPGEGSDSLNLYDVSTLGHFDLAQVLAGPSFLRLPLAIRRSVHTVPAALEADLHDQLEQAQSLSGHDPFALANPATNVDTVPHALGYAVQARMYDQLVHRPVFEGLATTQLGWVLGANAWGSSYVVGAGAVYPHCLAHQVANLQGSLDGRGRILRGATVDGPNTVSGLTGLGAPDGYRRCPTDRHDPFHAFDGQRTGYRDDVTSSSTSEPSGDYVALTLLAFAQQASTG